MAKKASISAVRKPAITALCGGATNILLNRPTEKNVHATEEVDAIDSPSTTSSTSVDHQAAADARRESNLEHNESTISPYTCSPVAIDVGPGLATYWAPKHLLRSPRWSTTDAGGIICLPGVSADTGHTLVHYLYTGTYQTLEARREDALAPVHIKFEQALLTFVLASTYELQDLEKLAKEQIEIYGSRMALVEVLDTVKDEFSKLTWSWLHKYLQARAEEQFDPDYTFFKSTAFAGSVGEGALQRFITSHVLELFSKRLTHALKGQESRCLSKEEPDALLEDVEDAAVKRIHCPCNNREHQTGMSTLGGDMSFEFPDVSRAEVNDVIFLENSVCDETPSTPPESEPVQPPETEPPAEILHEPVPDFEPVKEKKETELKEKEKEKATLAVAAMATNASTALSCAEPTANNDDWGSFAATTLGRKKKGKKGKAKPIAQPPPPAPAQPATSFEDVKFNDVNPDDDASKIHMSFVNTKNMSGSSFGGSGGWSFGWGPPSNKTLAGGGRDGEIKDASGNDSAWSESDRQKKDPSDFDFDFETFKTASGAAPPVEEKAPEDEGWGFDEVPSASRPEPEYPVECESVPEPEPVKEEDPWAFASIIGKKTTKGKEDKEESKIEEPSLPPPKPEPVLEEEAEAELPVSGPVPEEPAVDPFARLSKSQKKKLQEKMKRDAKRKEEDAAAAAVLPPPMQPEPLQIEPTVQEPNAVGQLGTGQDESPILEHGHKLKSQFTLQDPMPETSSQLCPRRSRHFYEGDGWKSCEQCRARVREIVVQLASDKLTVLL